MSHLIIELAQHGVDYADHITTIEQDQEREDLMGDLPQWENIDLNTFLMEYYGKKYDKKSGQFKWYPLEAKLGDGSWRGRNVTKDDALTESINLLAKRETTMYKFYSEDEVDLLRKSLNSLLEQGGTAEEAHVEATSYVYQKARQARWQNMTRQHGPAMKKLLYVGGLGITPNHIFRLCKEMLTENKTRDEFISSVQSLLQIEKLYGGPWKYLNAMYWNTKYWLDEEPGDIMMQCARRYAYASSWDKQVNGT